MSKKQMITDHAVLVDARDTVQAMCAESYLLNNLEPMTMLRQMLEEQADKADYAVHCTAMLEAVHLYLSTPEVAEALRGVRPVTLYGTFKPRHKVLNCIRALRNAYPVRVENSMVERFLRTYFIEQ